MRWKPALIILQFASRFIFYFFVSVWVNGRMGAWVYVYMCERKERIFHRSKQQSWWFNPVIHHWGRGISQISLSLALPLFSSRSLPRFLSSPNLSRSISRPPPLSFSLPLCQCNKNIDDVMTLMYFVDLSSASKTILKTLMAWWQ